MRIHVLAIAALVCATACGGSSDSPATTTGPGSNPPPTTPTATTKVSVGNDFFQPSAIQVTVGSTVTWTWDSNAVVHNVTFPDGSGSGNLGASATFSKTFSTAGTFSYQCTIHGMSGSIVVQ